MSITTFFRYKTRNNFPIIKPSRHWLWLVVSIWSTVIPADEARRIANQHANNWSQTLQTADIGDVMTLYDETHPTVIRPDGQLADTADEIARFWQVFLDKNPQHLSVNLMDAYFNRQNGLEPKNIVIARYKLTNTAPQKQIGFTLGDYDRVINVILKRQASGQWKTLLQNWN